MKKLILFLCLIFLPMAILADELYDNGPLVTHPGAGIFGLDASAVQDVSLEQAYAGYNASKFIARVADDFRVPEGEVWDLQLFEFFVYQQFSGFDPTITEINLRVWDGPPNFGGTLLADYSLDNLYFFGYFTGIMRSFESDLENYFRPVMSVWAYLPDTIFLFPGTYWVDWSLEGDLGPNVWVPPVSILGEAGKPGANALIHDLKFTSWSPIIDHGTTGKLNARQDLPFKIYGDRS